jgi:hypothetical protein
MIQRNRADQDVRARRVVAERAESFGNCLLDF